MAKLTPSQTIGPFYFEALRWGIQATDRPATGRTVIVSGRVLDVDGAPVDDALLEIWQPGFGADAACLPGLQRISTDDAGCFSFRMPGEDAIHFANVTIFARGLLRGLFTRVYLGSTDHVPAAVPADRRGTLVARPDPSASGRYRWDIRLRGDGETVFFDL